MSWFSSVNWRLAGTCPVVHQVQHETIAFVVALPESKRIQAGGSDVFNITS